MVNTAFALKFTTPCKLASKCGIYHLCFWFTPSLHSFFILHLSVFFLLSVCARGFGYLLCWPRGRRIGLVCTRRFSFHEFYNFLLLNFLILIFFGRLFFYPRQLPTPTTSTHDSRHLAITLVYKTSFKYFTQNTCAQLRTKHEL